MINKYEAEQIKNMLKNGFDDLELISFELDIPIEEIIQLKNELGKTEKTYSAKNIIEENNKKALTKMAQMREKYNRLFFGTNRPVDMQLPKGQSQQEKEIIDSVIATVEETIKEMEGISKEERSGKASSIVTEIKKIRGYTLTIEQSERLNSLIQAKELEKLNTKTTHKVDQHISQTKKNIIRKLAEAIDIAQSQTEDIEELKSLERKIIKESTPKNQIIIGAVRSRIKNKIISIQQKEVIDKLKNDVSPKIKTIIKDLAQGTLNIQEANEIIEKEAKKRVQKGPKTRFALTEEQQKKQILIQIKTVLKEKAEKYNIENPETTIMQIQELCGGELEGAIRTVVGNLIERKDFQSAKDLCDRFSTKNNSDLTIKDMIRLKKNIRNAELSDIILKGINMKGTQEEESMYFRIIEKGIETGNVNLGAISLGKSQDGLKNITLADIWPDENIKGRQLF